MQKEVYRERPNTEMILNDSEKWAFNETIVDIDEELNILLQIHERNYIQDMIYSKLTAARSPRIAGSLPD